MTPKEKAEDLWLTFYELLPDGIYSDYAAKEEARKFALTAVSEILYLLEDESNMIETYHFWIKVNQEIEKL